MKMFKRILTVCMVVAMLASMLVLASCGLFKSKVEKMYAKVADAKSYTTEYEDEDGEVQIVKVDIKNLMMYMASKDEDGKTTSEIYGWYDEDADKYYRATVIENTVTKSEMDKEDFFDTAINFVVPDASESFARQVEWGIYEKEDGVFTKTEEEGEGDNKITYVETIKVEDGVLIESNAETIAGKTTTTYSKLYDINKTEIEIPQNVLDAEAKKVD